MKKLFLFLLFLFAASNVSAETVTLDNGRVIEGQIIEVTDDYVRMIVGDEIMKLKFRNMAVDSADRYRGYTPKPYVAPVIDPAMVEPPPKTYKDFVREGLDLAANGRFEEAIAAFDTAIKRREDVPDIYLFRAGAYQEMGNVEKAVEDYDRAIKLIPNDPEVYARLGWLYQSVGQKDKAVEQYSRTLALDPYNFEILMERYNLYREMEQWWKAKDDLNMIIILSPDEGEPYLDQAILNYRLGSYYAAWQSVYEAGKRKVKTPPDFIEALKEKLEDPFLRKIDEKTLETFPEKVKAFTGKYVGFIVIVVIALILSIIVFLIPSKTKTIRPPVDEGGEEAEIRNFLRPVTLVPAHFSKRLCAGMIDLIVLSVIGWAAQILIISMDIFAAVVGVLFLLKDSFGGVSIGKGVVGLRVVDEHGYRSVFLQGFIRNFTLALPVIIFYVIFWGSRFNVNMTTRITLLALLFLFLLEGIVLILSKKEGRRIGDRMAGTFVHDLSPTLWRWPFIVLSVIFFAVFLVGTIVLNMEFHKAFLYKLNPLSYYNPEYEFSFRLPKGWKVETEGEGGLVLQSPGRDGSIVLVINQEAKEYALSLCADAFSRSMEDSGMELKNKEEATIAGRPAFKRGFVEKETDSAVLVIYFKEENTGPLYILQVVSPVAVMREVVKDGMALAESFRFE